MTYGKVLGGGLPVGAFAAKKQIMRQLAPEGPVYQAGTLSGNPIAMAAGLSTLQILNADQEIYTRLEKKTENLELGFKEILNNKGIPYQINRIGSMFSLHFTEQPVVDFQSATLGDNELFKNYFHGMLDQGIYLPPSAYESYFLNDAITFSDINYTIEAFRKVISKF